MLKITEQAGSGGIELILKGRIDTGEVAALQAAILRAFQKDIHVVLNFAQVDYLSSAALRALLIGQKTGTSKGGGMKLIRVPPQVMKVLQISIFSNILDIEAER